AGTAPPQFESWGHSMVVDPWGRVIAALTGEEGVAIADLDLAVLEEVRGRLPSLASRRSSTYDWPQEVSADALFGAGGPDRQDPGDPRRRRPGRRAAGLPRAPRRRHRRRGGRRLRPRLPLL